MMFLNPLYLIALAAASIPILIHLLNIRKTRVIEFSSLVFLKELQRSKIRKLKVRQWLLLALRTLIIVFIVLAFTRPALRSGFGFLPGATAKTSVVIVLDDSFSMFASDDRGNVFKQAKEKAREILDILHAGDEATIIRMSEAHKKEYDFTVALNALRAELDAAQPTFYHVDVVDAFTAASVALQKSNNINKEIYFITDDQRSHYVTEKPRQLRKLFDGSVKLFLVPLGRGKVDNTAVTSVQIENALFEKGRPVDLTATVLNDGSNALINGIASVFLDGNRVMQKTVDIDAGSMKTISFRVIPEKTGLVNGFIELEDDEIPEDNRRYFSFEIPDHVRVLLSSSDPQSAQIFRLSLDPPATPNGGADTLAEPSTSTFTVNSTASASLGAQNFDAYDVVALVGISDLTPSVQTKLLSFVENGGGLLLMPDPDGRIDAFTRFVQNLGLPAPNGLNGAANDKSKFSTFTAIDFDHPLFRRVFEKDDNGKPPTIESPHLNQSVRLRSGDRAEAVVSTSGGDAFLVDSRYGKGRVLVYAVPPSLGWSDFPLKGIFVPLMNRSMLFLASRSDAVRDEIVGQPFNVPLPSSVASSPYIDLKTPSGITVRIPARNYSTGPVLATDGVDEPGICLAMNRGTVLKEIPVNIDAEESRFEKVSARERDAVFTQLGIAHADDIGDAKNILAAVSEARFGVELWKYMLGLALICAALEMILSRDLRRTTVELPSRG